MGLRLDGILLAGGVRGWKLGLDGPPVKWGNVCIVCEMDAFPNGCDRPFDGFVRVQKAHMDTVNEGINVFWSKISNSTQTCRPTNALSSAQRTVLH